MEDDKRGDGPVTFEQHYGTDTTVKKLLSLHELDKLTLDVWTGDEESVPDTRLIAFHTAMTKTMTEPYGMRQVEGDDEWYLYPTLPGGLTTEELDYLALTTVALRKRLKSLDRVEGEGSRVPDVDRKLLNELSTVLLTWCLFLDSKE